MDNYRKDVSNIRRAFSVGRVYKDSHVQNTEATEDTQAVMELEDSMSTATNGSAGLDSVRKELQSKLQQCIVDVSVCNDTEALLCALKHATAAHASLHAVTKHRAARLPVQKKLPANKKLDKQLRLCNTSKEMTVTQTDAA